MGTEEIFAKYHGCRSKSAIDLCNYDTWNNCPGCEYELPHGVRRACEKIIRFRDEMNEWEEEYE